MTTEPSSAFQVIFTADSKSIVTEDSQCELQVRDACTDCENPRGLVALARTRVTRGLTPSEQREFAVG